MTKTFWIILTFVAGALLPVQAGLNTKLGKAAGNPVYAALFSFFVGIITLTVYLILTRQTVSWEGVKSAPIHAWLGGILGAFYVTLMIFAFPILGPGLAFGLIVAGQLLLSAILEHYGILVAQAQPITWVKLLGFLLVIVGVILVRK